MTAGPSTQDPTLDFEQHRRELTGYCYRMLGSIFDAEDAVQETLTRAWKAYDRFEGRSTVRTWLYRIASNVCFDMLRASKRRARPVDVGEAWAVGGPIGEPVEHERWIEPVPDQIVLTSDGDPAERAVTHESIRLAFLAAVQYLPPRQRSVLILRDVLAWQAREVAELLDTSVAAVNSALQRARATLASHDLAADRDRGVPVSEPDAALLDRYMRAFESYDLESLTHVIAEDATQSMPPYALWLSGREDIFAWWTGPGADCRNSRLVPTRANGLPAFGQYRPSGPNGEHRPWSLQVLEFEGGRIAHMTFFLDTARLFPLFGLPDEL
ncbi:MAG: sigma-70 family RNA polymerase sigma factor [Actinomycetota bacterium]